MAALAAVAVLLKDFEGAADFVLTATRLPKLAPQRSYHFCHVGARHGLSNLIYNLAPRPAVSPNIFLLRRRSLKDEMDGSQVVLQWKWTVPCDR